MNKARKFSRKKRKISNKFWGIREPIWIKLKIKAEQQRKNHK